MCKPTGRSKPGSLLEAIAHSLRSHGLDIREYRHGDELIEIKVVNLQKLNKGQASVGYDGNVTWEYTGDIETHVGIEGIRDTIVNVLTTDMARSSERAIGAQEETKS